MVELDRMFRNIWDTYVIFAILISNLGSFSSTGASANTDTQPKSDASISLAITECERLVETRRDVVNHLEEYVLNEERRLSAIKRILDRYKMEYEVAKNDAAKYMRNPLNAFTLIKRLTLDLDEGIKKHITTGIENIKNLTSFFDMQATMLPNHGDLRQAATGVRRIQVTYKFPVKELAEGKVNGVAFGLPLSSFDCFALSRILYNENDFYGAEDWAMEAVEKQEQEGGSEKDTELWITYLDDLQHEIKTYQQDPEADQIDTYAVWDREDWENEASVCRGEVPIPHNITKGLTCFLTTNHPFQRLAPVRTEQLYIDPNIFIFYDVISDEEIEEIKSITKPRLERAMIRVNTTDGSSVTSDIRNCKLMWLYDEWLEVIARISRRVGDLTGLNMTASAEPMQVVNYGIGGHYGAHYDFNVKYETKAERDIVQGNRIATILFYLSDVEQGGATAFLKLGLRVLPVKNAALFWMNLYPSGEGDLSTRHAACPVIEGSKWIATKWIRQLGQELLRPCTLEYQQEGEDVMM